MTLIAERLTVTLAPSSTLAWVCLMAAGNMAATMIMPTPMMMTAKRISMKVKPARVRGGGRRGERNFRFEISDFRFEKSDFKFEISDFRATISFTFDQRAVVAIDHQRHGVVVEPEFLVLLLGRDYGRRIWKRDLGHKIGIRCNSGGHGGLHRFYIFAGIEH